MPKEKKGTIIKGNTKGSKYGYGPGSAPKKSESPGQINKAGKGTKYGFNSNVKKAR